jgi:gamma-glutamylcyclotransferase (GGCT)/AIG2-like uncharacterized protein YtfP
MHDQLCRGVRSVMRAQLWGRLYELPTGCPALIVPEAARLAEASLAPAEDHALLEHALHAPAAVCSREGWRPVVGQLITLADYRAAWPTLDAWEDASPDRPLLFRRTLLRVERDNGLPITAWAYVVPRLPEGSRELVNGEWPVPAESFAGE